MSSYDYDVFVSHNRLQKPWVREVVTQWKNLGLRVFFDEEDIEPGEAILDGIERGLGGSEHVVLMISPSAMRSAWVAMEATMTIHADADAKKRRLIPVFIEPTDRASVRMPIQALNSVDLTNPDTRDRRYHHLLSFLTGEKDRTWPPLPPIDPRQQVIGLTRKAPPIEAPIFHMGSVVKPEFFIGRKKELAVSENIIRDGESLLLVGEFRDGKTSLCQMLIHNIMQRSSNDVFPVYMNVQSWPDVNLETFLEHTILGMIGDISRLVFGYRSTQLRRLARQGNILDPALERLTEIDAEVRTKTHTYRDKSPEPFRPGDFEHYYGELFEILESKEWNSCVVFYDEANKLPENLSPQKLIVHNESVARTGGVSVYAASPTQRESFTELRRSLPYQVPVEPFKRIEEMKELITRYYFKQTASTDELPADAHALERLWELSRGKPYLIQLLARRSFVLASDERATELRTKHVDKAYRQLIEEDSEGFFADGP